MTEEERGDLSRWPAGHHSAAGKKSAALRKENAALVEALKEALEECRVFLKDAAEEAEDYSKAAHRLERERDEAREALREAKYQLVCVHGLQASDQEEKEAHWQHRFTIDMSRAIEKIEQVLKGAGDGVP